MGTFTALEGIATALTVALVISAVVIGLAYVAVAVQFVAQNRPARLARHESLTTYYFKGSKGHAFAH